MEYKQGRLTGAEYPWSRDQRLWYDGQCYTVDRDMRFVNDKRLPCIVENVISPNGRIFNIYRGYGKSCLGGMMEFACAVQTGIIEKA